MIFSQDYFLGLCFIVLVAFIWAASSVVAQFVYQTGGDTDDDGSSGTSSSFHSPFLLTYIGTSLFTLWLPVRYLTQKVFATTTTMETTTAYQDLDTATRGTLHHGEEEELPPQSPYPEDVTTDNPQHATTAIVTTAVEEGGGGERGGVPSPHIMSNHHVELHPAAVRIWTNDDHFRVAVRIAPVWFLANWSYNASLFYTSITSSTVLASTSSLFTFLFAVSAKDEQFSWIKLVGVCLGVMGGISTAFHDAEHNHHTTDTDTTAGTLVHDKYNNNEEEDDDMWALLGDFLGLVSAVGYGAYAVQTRIYCPKDESLYSMQLVLGYIGILNMVVLAPFAIYTFWVYSMNHVMWIIMGCIVVKGLFDNFLRYVQFCFFFFFFLQMMIFWSFLPTYPSSIFNTTTITQLLPTRTLTHSDYLWLRAVLLTNATVATVGLGLTIPLAFVSDVVLGKPNVLTVTSLFGATAVLLGFVLVNVGTTTTNNNSSNTEEGDNTILDDATILSSHGAYRDDANVVSPPPPPMELPERFPVSDGGTSDTPTPTTTFPNRVMDDTFVNKTNRAID
jgi:solute carrier family 35 protein F5